MPKNSPPRHRHDGTSPLPLSMDWSPPPKRWEGRNTIWPHNPQTGWSYCVMIPSWIVKTEPGTSRESFLNPIVFYRVHVGIQSPEGFSSSHGSLRRFSDFLKLHSDLKKVFLKKDIPQAPPKHAFLRINSSRALLEERRRALDEWMGKLLSDIDISRSAPVAGFLELEAAARSSFQNDNHPKEPSSSTDAVTLAPSVADVYSEHSDRTSDLDTSKKWNIQVSETSTKHLAESSTVAIGNGLIDESFLDHPEDIVRSKLNHMNESHDTVLSGSSSRDQIESMSDQDHDKFSGHARKLSAESMGSDISSIRGSELSVTGTANSIWDGSLDVPGGFEIPNAIDAFAGTERQFLDHVQIVIPLDPKIKLNRVLVAIQQRLATTKTDMEDLIARLNQEIAVKEYLATKVKDLEVELEATEQKGKENLQRAILIERERVTQMQWDMDELRRKCSEMEAKLTYEENEKSHADSEKTFTSDEKELLLQELHNKQEDLLNTQKTLEELETKSKADIKVLVKEVKSLRKSQAELRELLNQSLKEKMQSEVVICREKQRWSDAQSATKKLLHECTVLRERLEECNVNILREEVNKFNICSSSLSDALDLLETSDNRIGLLLAEAQLLASDDEEAALYADDAQSSGFSESPIAEKSGILSSADDEIRNVLTDLLIDNARLRKQVNSVIRCALKNTDTKPEREGSSEAVPSRETVLNHFLER